MKNTQQRDGWVMTGTAVAAASAAVASFTGLRGLALIAGWPPGLAWLLPVTIDAYAMTSARVWLSGRRHTRRGRRFAQANAIGAILTSIVGNAAYHTISVHLLAVSWPVVVLVGAVPAAILGLTAHLHALPNVDRDPPSAQDRTESGPQESPKNEPEAGLKNRTEDRTESRLPVPARTRTRTRKRPKTRTEDGLMAAAREADARYRSAHGRPITRDALRTALRIAGPKATELRRRLATETTEPTSATTPTKGAEPVTVAGTPQDTTAPNRKEAYTTA